MLLNAMDPFALKHKGGKKGRKLMIRAAKMGLDVEVIPGPDEIVASRQGGSGAGSGAGTPGSQGPGTIRVQPNRIIDFASLLTQIRIFVSDISSNRQSMSLPPTDKETRKLIHEIAHEFGLKSVSKGKGDGRYTTLTKTTRTKAEMSVKMEKKVMRIVNRSRGGRAGGEFMGSASFGGFGGVGGGKMPRQREGEEVGSEAPKIASSNIGFKLLAQMGWAEGNKIGMEGGDGLKDPLKAVIKHTKLGLGAVRT
jgi:hypothetical protein